MHQMMMPEPKYSPPDDYGNVNYAGSADFFGSPHHHHHHHHHTSNLHNGQQGQHVGHQQTVVGGTGIGNVGGVGGVGGGAGGHYQGHYQQQMQAMYPSPGQTPSYYTAAGPAAPNYGAYQMHHNGHMPLEAQQPPAALMHNAAAQQCQGGSIPGGGGGANVPVMSHDIKDDSSPSPLPCHLQPSPSSSNHMSNNPLDGSCSDDMDDCNTDTDEMMMTTVNGSPIMMDDSESSDRVIYPWMKKNHVAGIRKSLLIYFPHSQYNPYRYYVYLLLNLVLSRIYDVIFLTNFFMTAVIHTYYVRICMCTGCRYRSGLIFSNFECDFIKKLSNIIKTPFVYIYTNAFV